MSVQRSSRGIAATCILLISLISGLVSCAPKGPTKPQLWIYTSIYKEVIAKLEPDLKVAFPQVDIQFFQGGSETVASKIHAELLGGRSNADLVMTSDPYWYEEMREAGHWLPYTSQAAAAVPSELKTDAYATVRIPVMVVGINPTRWGTRPRPGSLKDLATRPELKNEVSMGSPLESGTHFTTTLLLSQAQGLGWELLQGWQKHGILVAGGNSSVVTRLETGERPVGLVLMENLIMARTKGSQLEWIIPSEGLIPIPSPIAIVKTTRDPELTKKVYDWFFSPPAQKLIVEQGHMYSALPQHAPPTGAPRWTQLQAEKRILKLPAGWLASGMKAREAVKTRAAALFLGK